MYTVYSGNVTDSRCSTRLSRETFYFKRYCSDSVTYFSHLFRVLFSPRRSAFLSGLAPAQTTLPFSNALFFYITRFLTHPGTPNSVRANRYLRFTFRPQKQTDKSIVTLLYGNVTPSNVWQPNRRV